MTLCVTHVLAFVNDFQKIAQFSSSATELWACLRGDIYNEFSNHDLVKIYDVFIKIKIEKNRVDLIKAK